MLLVTCYMLYVTNKFPIAYNKLIAKSTDIAYHS